MHKKWQILFALVALVLLLPVTAAAKVIHVPADQPTIQDAINAANNGDTALVSAGRYTENINFMGKAITVTSSAGPKTTIIDGGEVAPVATFATGETTTSVLSGFTLQNGMATFNSEYDGGGVYISGASPTIQRNIIQNNTACNGGGGIAVEFGSPVIQGNRIIGNSQSGCSGGIGGGGISVGGAASAQIIGNEIGNNSWPGSGGGISLFAAGTPTIADNIIYSNNTDGGQGGGISMVNDSAAVVVQNLFFANSASEGTGIYFLVPDGASPPIFVNNTVVAGAGATQGAAVFAGGFDDQVQFYNNLLIGLSTENAVYCDSTYDPNPPTFTNNDAYAGNGSGLQGTCASQATQNGNISANPMFISPPRLNYQIQAGSPAINAGDNNAPDILKQDLAHHPRIVGGTIDMGAYEYQGTD